MAGFVVAVLLIGSLLLVHFSVRWQPLPRARPLDVDTGLPLPEAGQASTVFSLSALFGAYLGIHLLLGLPALVGVALGTVTGLLLIRRWIERQGPKSFEQYLSGVLGTGQANAVVLALSLAVVQCGFATSELVILHSIATAVLGVRSEHATLLVISLGLIAYFYVLFGGYMAVFRTDVLQFALVTVMGLGILAVAAPHRPATDWARLLPRPGYWVLPFSAGPALYLYHFILGITMGLGFLLASPDAWKRVFQVSKVGRKSRARFAVFLAVGIAPFLVLIPMGLAIPKVPDGEVSSRFVWAGLLASDSLFIAGALGLVASFLSAFNGALVVSVHLGLMARRRVSDVASEVPRFHWLMVTMVLTIFFLFAALRSADNPYVLANLLLGPYAILAGIKFGGGGSVNGVREGALLWLLVFMFTAWFAYFGTRGVTRLPSTYQINTVPFGVGLFAASAVSCRLLSIRRTKRA